MRCGWVWVVALSACGDGDKSEAGTSGSDTGSGDVTSATDSGGGETGSDDPPPEDSGSGGPDDGDSGGADRPCADATGELPSGLTTLSWDDGEGYTDVTELAWDYGGGPLATSRLFEAVRFDLDQPVRIHGFTVEYGALPDGEDTPVSAGLYADFGHNGFDFWRFEPLWAGSHCAGDLTEDEAVTYVLGAPLEVEQPGPIFVAHERQAGDAAWNMDISVAGDGSCASFTECHSAINMPDVTSLSTSDGTLSFWNGYSFSFRYDFLVRLHVEYLEPIAPEDKRFQRAETAESLGSRVSWGDYDGDGDADLFTSGPRLLRNDEGELVDVTEAAGLSGAASSGGVWGDFDNDGCLDLFAFVESGTAEDTLMHSQCDGTFVDVTTASGIVDAQAYNDCAGAGWTSAPATGAAWWDIDLDGLLDLYVSNFNCWSDYSHFTDRVWRNVGDGTFEEWTGTRGFRGDEDVRTPSRGANPIDHDQDGDIDLWVNNYVLDRNLFYNNQADGTVLEQGADLDLDGDPTEVGWSYYYGHTIGTAWGDLDNDGDFDGIAANLAHPRFWEFSNKTQVLIQQEDGTFEDIQGDWTTPHGAAGLRFQETHSVPALGDMDADGNLDLVITSTYDGRPTDFYWGRGDGTFSLDVHTTGIDLTNGWGVAVADVDNDGDLDLATSGGLYENTGESQHWLQLRPVGNLDSNHAAIGATVWVTVGDSLLLRHVSGGNGQGGQDDQVIHVGLGTSTTVDEVRVDFPAGASVTFDGPFAADQRIWLYEDGSTHLGWTP